MADGIQVGEERVEIAAEAGISGELKAAEFGIGNGGKEWHCTRQGGGNWDQQREWRGEQYQDGVGDYRGRVSGDGRQRNALIGAVG